MTSSVRRTSTSSNASTSTDVSCASSGSTDAPRARTRQRFTQEQLIVLEQKFHKASHPSRAEREDISRETGLDLKAVTIWFQNKRQNERKLALHNSTNRVNLWSLPPTFLSYPFNSRTVFNPNKGVRWTNSASQLSSISRVPSREFLPLSTVRPSLEHIAAYTEIPSREIPSTPKRSEVSGPGAVWDNMPSSPLQPSPSYISPLTMSRTYIEFSSKTRKEKLPKNLEWACAAARIAEREAASQVKTEEATLPAHILMEGYRFMIDDGMGYTYEDDAATEILSDSDESEVHEAITPDSSIGDMEAEWSASLPNTKGLGEAFKVKLEVKRAPSEEDVMTAAWALCGLKQQ